MASILKHFPLHSEWRGPEEMRSGVPVQGPEGGTALSGPEDTRRGETRQVSLRTRSLSCVYPTTTLLFFPKRKRHITRTTQYRPGQLKYV